MQNPREKVGMQQSSPTEDKLLGGRVRLLQPTTGYRAATDAVLLASAVPASYGERIMDLGSGAGAASMCLASRISGCQIEGVEVQSHLVSLAEKNIVLNGFEGRIRFSTADVSELQNSCELYFDHVMINPPYLQESRAQPAENLDPARIEVGIGLKDWVAAANLVVRDSGTMTFIHRADRVDELLARIRLVAGDIRLAPIWPALGREAKRVIVSARKGRRGPLKFCSGLILHDCEGAYTEVANRILHKGDALEF